MRAHLGLLQTAWDGAQSNGGPGHRGHLGNAWEGFKAEGDSEKRKRETKNASWRKTERALNFTNSDYETVAAFCLFVEEGEEKTFSNSNNPQSYQAPNS